MSQHSIESGYTSEEECSFNNLEIIAADAKRFAKSFSIEEEIIKSANGIVYSGFDLSTGEAVIVKQIPKTSVSEYIAMDGRQIPSEIYFQFKAAEACEAVVQPIDFFERKSSFVLVMEKIENVTDLYEFVRQHGALSAEAALFIFKQVIDAVQEMKSSGISHRDIKDENILIDPETLQVFIIDFGCASKTSSCSKPRGTPDYWTPEIYTTGSSSTESADCWALSALLYILLTGTWKFENLKVIRNFSQEKHLSPEFRSLFDRLFHPCPSKRLSISCLAKLL
ncbi:Oidioi.mRNA.OKI2018_I69.PAR.g11759.t1.cds [Oikopleura dioica]|uniref:Serine/threonine-protein kinase 1 n=1 Tax=Oikopleura dioica TaxID=34765 RepID=A0ABN7RXL3_OIKDI|nr:Oidioi.mRNA.OKI2018_I69.PAR.g11759.t1.cds [Oikopleura dioica]